MRKKLIKVIHKTENIILCAALAIFLVSSLAFVGVGVFGTVELDERMDKMKYFGSGRNVVTAVSDDTYFVLPELIGRDPLSEGKLSDEEKFELYQNLTWHGKTLETSFRRWDNGETVKLVGRRVWTYEYRWQIAE